MANPAIVNTAFEGYAAGTQITDPGIIAEILGSVYQDFITFIDAVVGTTPAITVNVDYASVGAPIVLIGSMVNGESMIAADFSVDGGTTWAPVANYGVGGNVWTGLGPVYNGPQSASIMVRDHFNQAVTASTNFTVTPSPYSVALSGVSASAVPLAVGANPTATAAIVGGNLSLLFGIPAPSTSAAGGFDISQYGAVAGNGSGGADCTPALEAAIAAAAGAEVVIHAGDWWFNTAFASSGARFVLRGHGVGQTRLHFPGAGWSISPGSTLNQVVIRDLSMWAENPTTANGAAVTITYPSAASSGYPTVLLEDIAFSGYPNSGNGTSPFPQTWQRGAVLVNTWGAYLRNCQFFGPPAAAGATQACMVEINGANDTRLDHAYQYYGHACVIQTGYCQGLYIDQPVIVKPDFVYAQTALTGWAGYSAQATSIDHLSLAAGGELNVLLGLFGPVANMLDVFISGANVTRNGGPSGAYTLLPMTDCSKVVVQGCNFLGGAGQTDTGISFAATFNSSRCRILGVLFDTFATGIAIANNGTVALTGNDLDFTNTTTPVNDQSGITSGNQILLRGHTSSTSPAGPASYRDLVVQNAQDWSVLHRIKSVQGVTDYPFWTPASAAGLAHVTLSTFNAVTGIELAPAQNIFLTPGGGTLTLGGSANGIVQTTGAAGVGPTLQFVGTDTVVNAAVQAQGGAVYLSGNAAGAAKGVYCAFQPPLDGTAGTVNITVTAGSAANPVPLISSTGDMQMAPTNRLWLGAIGGTGAVYSATIAGVTGNPGAGAAGKLWNNGGVVSLAGAALPQPQFAPAFLASQAFGDIAGSASLFSHFLPPTPPTPRTGLLHGDRWKAQGVFSAADFVAPSANVDSYPALQAWLLYVQAMFLAQSGTAYLNQFNRGYFTAYLPAGFYLISQPLIVPRWVRFGGPGVILPTPYVGAQSGGSLVSGVFDGTVNAQTNYTPLVVCAAQAHLGELNLYPAGLSGGFNYRTSGVVIGKNWTAQGALTVGSAGAGYSVGQVYLLANPDPAPYASTFVTVTAVNGSGGITAATVLYAGAYSLPPASCVYNGAAGLQETAWSAAAGYDGTHAAAVFDPAVPHALLVTTLSSGGGTAGSGASIIPTWQPDFAAGGQQYATGAVSVPSDTIADRITIHSAVQNNFSSEYGPTFNVMVSGLECAIGEIRGLGGRVGLWAINCQDLRIGILNVVDAGTFAWLRYFGSIECANCVIDTCGQAFLLDQGHGAIFDFRAFFEEGNIKNPLPPCNTGYNGSTSPGAISIGYGSTTTAPVTGCRLRGTMHNMGGLPASTITAKGLTGVSPSTQTALVCISNATDCTIDVQASNWAQYAASGGGPSPSLLPASALYSLGVNVDPGCVLRGLLDTLLVIDGVAVQAAIVSRTSGVQPPCHVDVRDTYHAARIKDQGLVDILGTGTPTSGTGGTGAGFAWPGSTYTDMATGFEYRNTGSLASPTWTLGSGTLGGVVVPPTLATSLPSGSGTLWNDGGVLAIS
jgi:hypothetical protein